MTAAKFRFSRLGLLVCSALAGVPAVAAAQPSLDQLQQEIRSRDAVIDQLTRRIEALERQGRANAAAARQPPPARAAAVPAPVAPPPPLLPLPSIAAVPPVAPPPAAPASGSTSEDVIARALENTLVNQGGLLLPAWTMQLVPDMRYSYQASNQLSFVSLGGSTALVTQRTRRDLAEFGLAVRLGLPWESQVEVRVPFGWDRGEATFGGVTTAQSRRSGLGDVSVQLSKQLLHERGPLPDVLVNVQYTAGTGSSSLSTRQVSTFPYAVGTGSGFDTLAAGVTLLKRQDPLVFLAALNYIHSFPARFGGIEQQPGEAIEVRVAPILAASPDTSLRLGLDTVFQGRGSSGGRSIAGSDQVVSILEAGAGIVLSPRVFLDASVGMGLTRDSPDFRAIISLPIRF